MQDIDIDTLATVTGGALSSTVSTSLAGITSSLNDLKCNNANNAGSNSLLLPVMMLALNNRRQQSVVSTPGATVVY